MPIRLTETILTLVWTHIWHTASFQRRRFKAMFGLSTKKHPQVMFCWNNNNYFKKKTPDHCSNHHWLFDHLFIIWSGFLTAYISLILNNQGVNLGQDDLCPPEKEGKIKAAHIKRWVEIGFRWLYPPPGFSKQLEWPCHKLIRALMPFLIPCILWGSQEFRFDCCTSSQLLQ